MNRSGVFLFGLACAVSIPKCLVAETTVDFKRDIRPILSNRCFACHGPDESKIEGGLQLDSFESATREADSGLAAIVPGQSSNSELVRRILAESDGERMPPAHFGARLTPTEIEKLKLWIDNGAIYAKHWSYDSLQKPSLDKANEVPGFESWDQHPVDRLLLRTLQSKGWIPSKQAELLTLVRRVAIDLTGLPPSFEQTQRLMSDHDPQVYEKWVDELLASPAFGEHWARKWLDLARYADSAGYADDPERTIWGYRDWVIRALNDGMPFDQFTYEQLAGDLLPNPTDDQLVATAFHRNTLTNNEGGTNDEEFRNVAVVDRVNTTMAVWMGVTMACAQCHSHKFDPISQKEYFEVFAIFNQTEDADRRDESPLLPWFTPEQRQQRESLFRDLEQTKQKLAAPASEWAEAQSKWADQFKTPIKWESVRPARAESKSKSVFTIQDDGRIRVQNDADHDTYTIQWRVSSPSELAEVTGIAVRSIPDASLPGGGAAIGNGNFILTNVSARIVDGNQKGRSGRFVRVELPGKEKILSLAEVQVFAGGKNVAPKGKASQINEAYAGAATRAIDGNTNGDYNKNSTTHTETCESPWWEVDLQEKELVEKIVVWNRTDGNVGGRLAGAKVSLLDEDRSPVHSFTIDDPKPSQSEELLRSIQLQWLAAGADYSQPDFGASLAIDQDNKSGWAVGFAIDKPHELNLAIDQSALREQLSHWTAPVTLELELDFRSVHRRHVLASFSLAVTKDQRLGEWAQLHSPIQAILKKDVTDRSKEDLEMLHQYYVSEVAPERYFLRETRKKIEKELASMKPATTVPVMRDLAREKGRTTFVQLRGNYKALGEKVEPALPTAFPPLKQREKTDQPLNRMDLARWLMQPDNPLTARVVANRYWENLFGTGIVRTSEEFGSQGDLPTHPELLDFLATELIRNEWDTKKFLRMIVLSSAYKQTSSVSKERFEEDPDNIYISRGPRFRATAEQIRDNALFASGLLSGRMYGPPTRPPQPSLGLSAAFGGRTDWDTSKGEDRYRRGLYTQWRRSNPYPSMATFDAPNREVCVLKRDRTNTPLQALVTLNDPAFMEAAQGLARRVVLHELKEGSIEQRATRIFEHSLGRPPSPRELNTTSQLYQETFHELKTVPDRANNLATDPLGPLPAGANVTELAAWTAVCNVVLNLDEFLMKR